MVMCMCKKNRTFAAGRKTPMASEETRIPAERKQLNNRQNTTMTENYIVSGEYYGFRLLRKKFVKEVNAECLQFEHTQSGARLFKILSADPNKTFCIGFKTVPDSDNGAPHILEHSVLNGSESFPVKSPFDVLLKGSLSTFLNAFTSKDYTMYPVASMNLKDYFNLVHVYLDAVFRPLIYKDPRIFMQEGWHYEATGTDDPLVYTGVVYNEMKGAMSNPQRELWYQVFKHLFPDSPYGYESGGHPETIPTLTYEQFIDFHRQHYHPENSYIFLYGDADTNSELEFIHTRYLVDFHRTGSEVTIPDQPPFEAMREVTCHYPVVEGQATDNQTFLTYNVVAGQNDDLVLTMALDILCEVLVNQESAPLRLALQEAGIGQEVSASSSNFKQHAVQIAVMNANPEDRLRFHEIVISTLKKAVSEGIDKQEIEGVINRMEFRLREGDDAQKGLNYLNQCLARWFFGNDPFSGLEYEPVLDEIKKSLTGDYLEQIIDRWFLRNTHSLLLSLEPLPGLDLERNRKEELKLAAYKDQLSGDELDTLIRGTTELIEFQQREDSVEALSRMPELKISDINPKVIPIRFDTATAGGVTCVNHHVFTNGVVYVNLCFDLTAIPLEMVPYASLLSGLLGSLDTLHYSFGELNKSLNIHTGGFYTSLRHYPGGEDDQNLLPKYMVSVKSITGKLAKLAELTSEILLNSRFDDPVRLKMLLARHFSHLDSQIKGNGFQVASRRINSYFSKSGMMGELTAGISYYHFIGELLRDFDNRSAQIQKNLEEIKYLLFRKENLVAGLTCEERDRTLFYDHFQTFLHKLPSELIRHHQWDLLPEKLNEGLLAASHVQYVVQGYNFKCLGYSWDGRMRLLNQVLSTDWLQTQVRVIGGAYGGFCSISPSGNFTFNSYRDPNLENTLEIYGQTVKYLQEFDADELTMSRYIIGTIGEMDNPLTPSQTGNKALYLYFTGRTDNDRQAERDAVLSSEPGHIRGFAPMVRDILAQDAICVYGNSEKLSGARHLFKSLVDISKF